MIDRDLVTVSAVSLLSATEDFDDRLSQTKWGNPEEGDKTTAHFKCILAFVRQRAELVENFLKEQEDSE